MRLRVEANNITTQKEYMFRVKDMIVHLAVWLYGCMDVVLCMLSYVYKKKKSRIYVRRKRRGRGEKGLQTDI